MNFSFTYHRLPLSSERDVVQCLKSACESRGMGTKTEWKLPFGFIDLVAWDEKRILLYEVKHNAGFNDIIQAFGQLLIYREQMQKVASNLKAIIHARVHFLSKEEIDFLKDVLAKYNVRLSVEEVLV